MTADRGEAYYRDFAAAYDRFSRGLPGDLEFYVDLAREAGSPVVELGVGTGRVAIPTAQAGITVTGIDREPAMLAIAREKAEAAHVLDRLDLREGDMRTFEVEAPVALVTIPFRTFLHNLTTDDQMATLASCRQALAPGGRLALNVFNPDLRLIARWLDRGRAHWEPFAGDRMEAQHRYEPTAQISTTTLRVKDEAGKWRRTSFRLRYVHQYEMRHLLERSGFEVEHLWGGFQGEPFDEDATEMVWVARRRDD